MAGGVAPRRGLRPRSLRYHAYLVVLATVAAPVAFVWLSNLADATTGLRLQQKLERVAAEGAPAAAAGDRAALVELADARGVRLRVVDGDQVALDLDAENAVTLMNRLANVFFGPDDAPSMAEWDASQTPLPLRPEVQQARAEGRASRCAEDGGLLICAAAARDGDVVVHAQESSRRAIRALYDVRYQITKLGIFVLILGLALASWIGWRMVRPLEALQAQVQARTEAGSIAPIEVDRDDEFGDLALSFNALLATLQERSQANEAFAADLVHELKNPLAAVAAVAESLETAAGVDAVRAARMARILRSSGTRLEALAQRFLELARAEAGLIASERERADLAAMLRALIASYQLDPRFSGVSFRLHAPAKAEVVGVMERLETAVRNLLDNAAAFTRQAHPEGGGEVVAEVERRGEEVVVTITDNGPGVPPADLPRIFDRFFSRRSGGTGLGLALTRAIAQAHGGSVVARSAPGQGAAFRLRLPAAGGGGEAPPARRAAG